MKLLDNITYKGATIKLYIKTNVQYKVTIKLPTETKAIPFYYDGHLTKGTYSERESALKQAHDYVKEYLEC